jgi:hypothetical protein
MGIPVAAKGKVRCKKEITGDAFKCRPSFFEKYWKDAEGRKRFYEIEREER